MASSSSAAGSLKRKREDGTGDKFGMSDPDEMNYLVYQQFLSKDYDGANGRQVKVTNGWQAETIASRQSRAEWEHLPQFRGRVAINNNAKMEQMGSHSANAFMFVGDEGKIFQQMKEELKPYYTYTFHAKKGDRPGLRGKEVYFVQPDTLKWEPMPMNYHLTKHLFENELTGAKQQYFRNVMLGALNKIQDRQKVLSLMDLEALLRDHPNEAVRLRNMPSIKRLFHHDRLQHLYPFYNMNDLLYLPVESINTLYRHVAECVDRSDPMNVRQLNDPTSLCFWSTLRHLGMRCEDFDKVWYLPEMSYEMFKIVCARRSFYPHAVNELSVMLYDKLLAQHYDEGHKYLTVHALKLLAGSVSEAMFENALDQLTDRDMYHAMHRELIPKTKTYIVYPRTAALCEKMIVAGVESVLTRYQYQPPIYCMEDKAKTYPLLPDSTPCSEQLTFLHWAKNLPIVNVSGQAGAGKSAGLTRYLAYLDAIDEKDKLVFSTYQGNNASEAQEENTTFAETAHRILARHACKCKRSPMYKEKPKKRRTDGTPNTMQNFLVQNDKDDDDCEYTNCPLENVKVLIIDEIGLFYDELFAVLIHVLTTCGKLCQIITSGDHRQQVQIQPGRLQLDLFKGFAPWTLEYNHTHRYDDDRAMIFRNNADAIDKMQPERIYYEDDIFQLHPPARAYKNKEHYQFLPECTSILKSIGLNDSERNMLVTRTHVLKDLSTKAIEEVHYGNVSPYALRVGSKITCTKNNYDIDMVSNRILVLEAIEDCLIPGGRTLNSLDEIDYLTLTKAPNSYEPQDTVKDRKPRGLARRLRARVANRKKIVYIPYDGRFKNLVKRAAAVTERSCQGSSAHHVAAVKLGFWQKADVKEGAYVVCTRQRERLSLIMDKYTFEKWITNPTPPRNSIMHVKFAALYETYKNKYPIPATPIDIAMLKVEEGIKYEPVFDLEVVKRQALLRRAQRAKIARDQQQAKQAAALKTWRGVT
jgi:AAA domain